MKHLRPAFLLLLAIAFNINAQNDRIEPVDLQPFVGKSQFDRFNVPWLIPTGVQVANGIPFKIDGVLELYGKSAVQGTLHIRTNVSGIPINRTFEGFHLLCATTGGSPTLDVPVAHLHLHYADGSSNKVSILFGRHIRQWWGPRHEEDSDLADRRNKPAWSLEFSDAAKADKRSRFFHSFLENPFPEKRVNTIDIESAQSIAALMLAGISTGPRNAPPLPNTLPNQPPDPEKLVRSGEPTILQGTVREISGKPLRDAIVRITGTRDLKASDLSTTTDHPSVGMETRTDKSGNFQFSNLPDNRLYRLLFQSEALEPYVFYGADSTRGPIEVRLKPFEALKPSKKLFVHARILGPDGLPVLGATIEPNAVTKPDETTCYGCREEFPSSVTSDSAGEFIFEREMPFVRLQVEITAAGLAPAKIWLPVTNTIHTIQLGVGATLTGRVLKDDQPLANVEVAVSGAERNSEVYAGNYKARTDAEGRFALAHLPPNTRWYFYGVVDSMKSHGALRVRPTQTSDHGTTNDLGDLSITEGLTVAGRVVAASGELPSRIRVTVGFEKAWHSTSTIAGPDGSFELTGLFPETVTLSVDNSQWNPAPVNRNLDIHNPWRLIGILDESK
ncbi:MAG: hypothetical protein ACK4UN_16910, partial [Limisphaerales bacterium]